MATPSRASLAKLYSELAPVPEHIALAVLSYWTDEQVVALANSISAVLTPDEVFSAGAVAQLATDRADLYNMTEAVVYAGHPDPGRGLHGCVRDGEAPSLGHRRRLDPRIIQ